MLYVRSAMLLLDLREKVVAALTTNRDEGQALSEYSIIIGLIAVAAITALALLGTKTTHFIDQVANGF